VRLLHSLSPLARGRLALLAAGVLWSLGGVFIKRLPVGPIAITFYRSLFAALALLLCAAIRQRPARNGERDRRPFPPLWELIVSVVLFAVLLITFVAATRLTTAANAIILQYTAPIYVIGFSALLLREPPRPADRAALALCMTGVLVLFVGSYRPGGSGLGLLLALISGASFGLFMLWQRRLRGIDPVLLAGLNNAGASLLFAAAIPWMGPVSAPSLLTLIGMGIVQIALPYALFTWALQHVPGPEASLLTLVEPVLNPVWVALFAAEIPGRATAAGGALILSALLLRYTVWRPESPAGRTIAP
jgi:drug/metabolite transporter (DMT)-like permease